MTDLLKDSIAATYDVSVVVPMYKVEQFLPCCVESLLSQSLGTRLQIVLIDDGSPDACGELGDKYAELYDNVLCVHRENGGLGPARNTGIRNALGRYIGFVDSDDWVDKTMYERLYSVANSSKADVVFSGMRTVAHGKELEVYPQPYGDRVFSGKSQIDSFRNTFFGAAPEKVIMEPMQVSVCPAIYRASVINQFDLKFENIRSEDVAFNLDFLAHALRIACVDDIFYNYRKDDQASITSTFRLGVIAEYYKFFDSVAKRLPSESEPSHEDASLRFNRRVIDCCRGMLVSTYTSLNRNIQDEAADCILKSTYLKNSMCNYPWYKIPIPQGLYLLAMKNDWKPLLRLFSMLRSGR